MEKDLSTTAKGAEYTGDICFRCVKATKRADRCMDAKKYRCVVGFVERCFGEVCQNRPVMLNLIQHLLMLINTINIDRLRVCLVARIKRVCNAVAFASSFRPLRAIRKPAMTGRLFSMGAREQASFAKQTDMNLSLFTSHFSRKCKGYAFTLAEVLITLGIIGVVAALTLPSVIQKYNEQATVTKVKKFYSTFSQAYLMAVNDNDTIDNWGLEATTTETDDDGNQDYSDDAIEQSEKFLQIMDKYLRKVTYQKLEKHNKRDFTNGYVLPDGTAITAVYFYPADVCLRITSDYCADVYFRTQGKSNNEKESKYMFALQIYKHHVLPLGLGQKQFENYCLKGTNYAYCTAWVITNGNMDYLHCPDDLSWGGKTKCK